MATLTIDLKKQRGKKKLSVDIDKYQFERLMSALGLFQDGFLESLDRSEKDIKAGRVKKLRSLRDLR